MKKKHILSVSAVMAAMLMLSACAGTHATSSDGSSASADASTQAAPAAPVAEGVIHNFEPVQAGEKIAVIKVKDHGEIKIKLFPEQAQLGVENFTGLIEMNYYDELIFHRIIPNFMNQGGDPKGTGTGGNSIWGNRFDGGIPKGLYHFTGAVAYANSGSTDSDGSQFYIVNTPDGYMQNTCEELMEYDSTRYSWPQNVIDMYHEKGGVPFLDGGYTVFGQVFEGIDVVREIAQVETNDSDKPLTPVVMESVRIVEFEG